MRTCVALPYPAHLRARWPAGPSPWLGISCVRNVLRGLRARFGLRSPDVASRPPAVHRTPLARFASAVCDNRAKRPPEPRGLPTCRRPPQAKTTMTLKGDDKQHDAYRKKKAAQYKEPRALTEDELAEVQAREIAEKRAAKAHVPLAAINRGDFRRGQPRARAARSPPTRPHARVHTPQAQEGSKRKRREARGAARGARREEGRGVRGLEEGLRAAAVRVLGTGLAEVESQVREDRRLLPRRLLPVAVVARGRRGPELPLSYPDDVCGHAAPVSTIDIVNINSACPRGGGVRRRSPLGTCRRPSREETRVLHARGPPFQRSGRSRVSSAMNRLRAYRPGARLSPRLGAIRNLALAACKTLGMPVGAAKQASAWCVTCAALQRVPAGRQTRHRSSPYELQLAAVTSTALPAAHSKGSLCARSPEVVVPPTARKSTASVCSMTPPLQVTFLVATTTALQPERVFIGGLGYCGLRIAEQFHDTYDCAVAGCVRSPRSKRL